MRRPLVVLDALVLHPAPTGVGRAILEWTRALAAEERFCDFAVLCTHPQLLGHLETKPGWRVVPCRGAGGGTLRRAWWIQTTMPRLLRRLRADLLHCLQFVAPLRAPCPLVLTVHDLAYLAYPATIEASRGAYYRWLVPRAVRRAAVVVCNSQATAAEVQRRFPSAAGRVLVAPWGVPTWTAGRQPAADRDLATAPFLFVGTLEPRKNLERLLAAYTAFRQQRQQMARACPELVLAGGRGWRDGRLRRQLAAAVAAGGVVLKGYCGPDELWRQYGLARALLMPSLHEGFGFPILEAMAAGTPVMTSKRGAMAEVAGDAALLVDPLDVADMANGMRRLVDDLDLWRDLASRGRQNLARWSWPETAAAACEAYRRALAGA